MLKYLQLCVEDSMQGDYGIRIRIYKHSAKYELLYDSRYRSKNTIKPHNPLPVDNPNRLSEWDTLGVNTWNDEYFKPFCDGAFWKLTYREEGEKARTITGCNDYPPRWSQFIEWLDALKPQMQFAKGKKDKGRDIDPEIEDKLCDLLEAKTDAEKEAIWRELLDSDDWKLSKEDMDFLLGRDGQSPEGEA